MTPYYADESVMLWHGDCLAVLRTLPDASVDSTCRCGPGSRRPHYWTR